MPTEAADPVVEVINRDEEDVGLFNLGCQRESQGGEE